MIHAHNCRLQSHLPLSLRWLAACLAFLLIPAGSIFAAATWTGGGTSTNTYWSDPANWSGGAGPGTNGPSTTTNALVFSGTTDQSNTNDLAGLEVGPITMSTAGWNIEGLNGGTNVVLQAGGGTWTASVSGTSTWGLDTFLNTGASFTQSGTADTLVLSGVISGTATGNGIAKAEGSAGQGSVILANTNNSFIGQVNIRTGQIVAYSLAVAGQNSSLGAATGTQAPILIGITGTGYGGRLIFAGSNNCTTDRQLQFANNTTGGTAGFPTGFYNNSPNNSSLNFIQDVNDDYYTFADGTSGDVFPLVLQGTSTGTNTFFSQLGTGVSPYWGGSLYIGGSGTWAFSNLVVMTGSLIVSNTAHFTLLYNSAYPSLSDLPVLSQVTVLPGGTFDVSSYDTNDSVFVLASYNGYPQTMTVGRTNGEAPATDINGSLSLAGPASATLNVAGTGVPGTLTVSSNFIAGSGTIKFDLGTNTTAGMGTNDLIYVGGNLDLSQGGAVVGVNLTKGALATNTPYALISYSGSLIGSVSGLSVPSPSRSYNPGVVTAANGLVQVTFNPSGQTNATLVWQGNDGANWDVQVTPNWLNGSSSDYFFQGDNVSFNDSASDFNVNVVGLPAPATIIVSNGFNAYFISSASSGSIGGGSLTKQGSQELTITTANTYTGGTVISGGTISAGNNTALGSGTITLGDSNTGTNAVSLVLNNTAVLGNSIIVSSNGTGTATIGWESGGAGTFNGTVTMGRGLTLYTVNDVGTSSLLMQGNISGTGDLTIAGGGSVKLQSASDVFTGNIYITSGSPGSLTYLGVNTALSTNCNVTVASNAVFGNVSSPNINALNGGGLIEPGFNAAYTAPIGIGYANGSGTFSGSFTTNNNGYSCTLEKYGTGTETLTGDNSLSGSTADGGGATIVIGGTLAVNNTTNYGLGLGGVTVDAGSTLAGTGIIYATNNNTFSVSGILSVGNAGDTSGQTFTLTNTAGLIINSGGAVDADLFSGAGAGNNTNNAAAADVLNAQGPVTLSSGAILNVANPNNLTAWAVGDKWKIASWSSIPAGTFTTLNLPALPGTLAWDTTSLYSAGVIGIVANSAPTRPANILGVTVSGNNLVINGTNLNGGQSFHYAVLTSTNLTVPLTNWTALSTNSFNANGTFSYTNAINPTNLAAFFSVKAVQ